MDWAENDFLINLERYRRRGSLLVLRVLSKVGEYVFVLDEYKYTNMYMYMDSFQWSFVSIAHMYIKTYQLF